MKTRQTHHQFRYKNISMVVFGLFLAVFVARFEVFHSFLLHLGNLGYVGAFIAGMLFVSTFTFGTGAVVLLVLAESLSPVEIGLVAGMGAVVGDFVVFHLVRDSLATEIQDIYTRIDRKNHLKKVFHSKYFSWTLPVLGSLIIASPLPDELGVSLLGLSKTNSLKFILISYILNSIGIFLVVSVSAFVKP